MVMVATIVVVVTHFMDYMNVRLTYWMIFLTHFQTPLLYSIPLFHSCCGTGTGSSRIGCIGSSTSRGRARRGGSTALGYYILGLL